MVTSGKSPLDVITYNLSVWNDSLISATGGWRSMDQIHRIREDPGAFVFAILRLLIGFMLLWAFFDKMFGLGFPTASGAGYIDGGSPTEGFLMFASTGTFGWLFEPLTRITPVMDVIILISMLGLGTGLMLGIGKRICCVGGMVMFFIFYLAVMPLSDNPIIDYHTIYIVVLAGVLLTDSCSILGMGNRWRDTALVRRFPILE